MGMPRSWMIGPVMASVHAYRCPWLEASAWHRGGWQTYCGTSGGSPPDVDIPGPSIVG